MIFSHHSRKNGTTGAGGVSVSFCSGIIESTTRHINVRANDATNTIRGVSLTVAVVG